MFRNSKCNMAARGSRNNAGIQRVLQKLNKSIEEGNYYEAHQMIRTLYFRYMSQKHYQDAVELIHNGACLFLKHKQEGSGTDLAMLMLECFKDSHYAVNEDALEKICSIFQLFECDSDNREQFINAAIKWTADTDKSLKYGHQALHHLCAEVYWREKNYSDSRYHFLYSSSHGRQFATMLVEYSTTQGYPGEADLFVTQAVLQILCLQNTSTASVVFFKYTDQHPSLSDEDPPFQKPLLNFVWFLLLVIERKGTLHQFTVLCENYQPSIERDPAYKEYLDRIGQIFFGLPPKEAPSRGLLGGVLDNLIMSFVGEDKEEPVAGSSTSTLLQEDVD